MIRIRRLVAVSSVLAVAAVYSAARVSGESDGAAHKPLKTSRGAGAPAEVDGSADLAATKFASGAPLTYRTADGGKLFALQIKPQLPPAADRPRDCLLMVDTSASQVGLPLATAVRLVEEFVGGARPQDRVAIWTVNTPAATLDLTHGFVSAQSEAARGAIAQLREQVPLGDTDLKGGLAKALASFGSDAGRQRAVVFLGDGMSTHNPIAASDRIRLGEDMVRQEVGFFPVPLGPRLDPQNIHGLATATGGIVVRVLPRDQAADVTGRLHQALAAPVLYPNSFQLTGAPVAQNFPTRLPPLRPDAPTLVIGQAGEGTTVGYTIEGTIAGREARVEKAEALPEPEFDNFFLVGMVEQWKSAKDQPALMQSDRALAFAQEINQIARADLLTQAEAALATDQFDAASRLFGQAKGLDPNDAEAQGGLRVVALLRDGKLTKEQLRRQFTKREGMGVRIEKEVDASGKSEVRVRRDRLDKLLAQAEPVPLPATQPPAAAPTPGDMLRREQQLQSIEEQRVRQTVDDTIREARRLLPTDPDGARDLLKRVYATVRDDIELTDVARQTLLNRMENALRNVETEGAIVRRNQADRLRLQAIAQEQAQQAEARTAIENTFKARMRVFHALMDQARFEEAYKQSLAIIQDAINQGHPIPVAVTAAHDIGLVATNLREVQEIKRVTEERWLLTMLQVEKSHVPFPDEPPVAFPPAATWRQLTAMRKERYENSGLTDDDPITLRRIRELEHILSTPVPSVELDTGSLRDALGYLSDRFNVPIVIDSEAFKEQGVQDIESQTVRLSRLSNISLSTVLRLLLAQVQGTYIIRRDFIEVTTGQRQAAEKVLRVYPVADLVIPIPNAFNQQAVNQTINNSILGFQLSAIQSISQNPFAFGLTGVGLAGVGLAGGAGLGGAGLAGLTGLAGIQGGAGGFAGLGGLAGNIGGVGGVGGGTVQNLGVGGGGVAGFAGFGGQLGQLGNLGGQFGLQGGDQSQILIKLITQVIGTPRDWAPPGTLQRLETGGVKGTAAGNAEQDEPAGDPESGSQLGYYPPARALLVKATSRIHTRYSGSVLPANRQGPPGGAALDLKKDDGIAKAEPKAKPGDRGKDRAPPGTPDPDNGGIAKAKIKGPGEAVAANVKVPGKDLEPRKVWQEALAKGVNDPGLIIACADFLFDHGYFTHAAEFLKADLRKGIVARPWVYEALAVALQQSGGSPDEIERAQLSAVDLEPQDAGGYLRAGKSMATAKRYDRALAFCRQASLLEPDSSDPYADALLYSEMAKDARTMEWAATNLLSRDWPEGASQLHDKARDRLRTLGRVLAAERRAAEADRLSTAADRSRARDLVVKLSWQGQADLDLEIREPVGTTCSFLQRQTPGGGTLIGDTLDDLSHETYTAAQGFSGTYEIKVRRVWGRPLGSKATVEVIRHQGTPDETRSRQTLVVDQNAATVKVELPDGRRRAVAQVPATTPTRRRSVAADNPDQILNQLRSLADPDMAPSTDTGMRGAAASTSGTPTGSPEGMVGVPVGYATASDLAAQAASRRDPRFVRLSVAGTLTTPAGLQSLVVNPVIPGGPQPPP